jgi:hypothetical protein
MRSYAGLGITNPPVADGPASPASPPAQPKGAGHGVNRRKEFAEIRRGVINPPARGLSEDEVSSLEEHSTEIESVLETFEFQR